MNGSGKFKRLPRCRRIEVRHGAVLANNQVATLSAGSQLVMWWLPGVALVGVLVALFLPAFQRSDSRARSPCQRNQHQIAVALASYEQDHGSLPPAFIADEQGRPMHSWRSVDPTLLRSARLYDDYKFDEPWNGPNNSKLHSRVVECFSCPTDEQTIPGQTSYVAVVGPETAWPAPGKARSRDFRDGKSNSLLIVDVANSGILWMEPRDLDFATMSFHVNPSSGVGISSHHGTFAIVTYADGRPSYVGESLSTDWIRAAPHDRRRRGPLTAAMNDVRGCWLSVPHSAIRGHHFFGPPGNRWPATSIGTA